MGYLAVGVGNCVYCIAHTIAIMYSIINHTLAIANLYEGITNRLDYLESLGVGAVWLSPIYKSPMKDFGYDISSYDEIDPLFGTMEDFENLLQAMHKRGNYFSFHRL